MLHLSISDPFGIFWTFSRLFSFGRFCKWIFTFVSTLFPYHARSHPTSNCNDLLFNHDQTFRWSSTHCHGGNIVLIHKWHIMLLISQCCCNTFFLTPIWSCSHKWMWSYDPWYHVHFGPSPWLGGFLVGHGECFQFGVKNSHISKISCNRWGHHIIHPLCSCILLCIWISFILLSL
jgi:hypothetical protein